MMGTPGPPALNGNRKQLHCLVGLCCLSTRFGLACHGDGGDAPVELHLYNTTNGGMSGLHFDPMFRM